MGREGLIGAKEEAGVDGREVAVKVKFVQKTNEARDG